MTAIPPDILIQEVAPRDGLQIDAKWVETGEKIRLINSLSAIGFRRIEVSVRISGGRSIAAGRGGGIRRHRAASRHDLYGAHPKPERCRTGAGSTCQRGQFRDVGE